MMRGLQLLCVFSLLSLPLGAPAQQDAAQTLEQTSKALEDQRAKAKAIEAESQQVRRDIETLEKESTQLVATIRQTQEQMAQARQRIDTLQREQQAKRTLLDDRKDQLARLLSGMIRMRRLPAHYVAAQPLELNALVRTAGALDVTFSATRSAFNSINAEYAALTQLSEELEARKSRLDVQLAGVQQKQDDLTQLIGKRRKLQQSLQRDHAQVAKRVKELSDKSGDLQELIARLEAETTLFQSVGTPSSKPDAPKAAAAQSLASRKGALAYPAAGRILHRFGEKRAGDERYQGVEIATASRAPVTAPHAGRVVFSGDFMDYGPMVILEHDKTYHSVIAGLDVVAVEPGQRIHGGELIGTMGASPSQTLYFELRKHSKAIDPAAWMGNVSVATRN